MWREARDDVDAGNRDDDSEKMREHSADRGAFLDHVSVRLLSR